SMLSTIKFVAVPVDIKQNKINLNALVSATTAISKGLKKGHTVVICPSLPPGTTEKLVKQILEKHSKLKVEKDFNLIYNPERIFEGRALQDIEENYPAIVSGYGRKSLKFADELLKIISKKGTLKMTSLANAEAEKLFEGVYRDVNIALANELSEYCEQIGVNYWDARKGANSQPYCHLHYPGTGVGGLCIPVYPKFVIESSKKIGKHVKLIEYSRKINDQKPKKCVQDALSLFKNNVKGIKVAVLGLGFRGEVTDSRLSPTYTVVNELLKKQCNVIVHDPYIFEDNILPKNVILTKNLSEAMSEVDLIFISADHNIYKKLNEKLLKKAKKSTVIFDGRNILNETFFKNTSILTVGKRN
ncbi:nucleotide sugar dehydrogenase, partial [Nitrosopumilus sp.]